MTDDLLPEACGRPHDEPVDTFVKITTNLIGQKIRQPGWPEEEFLRILFVGKDWVVAINHLNQEIVFPLNKNNAYLKIEEEE